MSFDYNNDDHDYDHGRLNRLLILPEMTDHPALQDPEPREILQDFADFQCNDISSLVALAFHLNVPVFDGTVAETKSGTAVQIGSGAFATVWRTELRQGIRQKYQRGAKAESISSGLASSPSLGPNHNLAQSAVIKRVFTEDRLNDEIAVAEISQELRILGQKHIQEHRNIVDIIGLDWERYPFGVPGAPYRLPALLLEYGDCGTLEDFFRLQGIEYTWEVKVHLLYDIANGLDALSDSEVCHGDLKLTNVLVFRNGKNSFLAKLCDFGSAVVAIDVDTKFCLKSFTPPWNAPESVEDVDRDDLDKVDFYGYGLIACRVALEGGNPFDIALDGTPEADDLVARNAAIRTWKSQDKVSEICLSAIKRASGIHYTGAQFEMLSTLIDCTVRTSASNRADEYSEIKFLLKPEENVEENKWSSEHIEEELQALWGRTIPYLFGRNWRESIPSIGLCWARIPARGPIAQQIFGDIEALASVSAEIRIQPGWESRAAEAEYAMALCLIQGFGCDQDISRGCNILIRSVRSDCSRAIKCVFRTLKALSIDLPEEYHHMVALEARKDVLASGDKRRMRDLAQISPDAYNETINELRTNEELAMDLFGYKLVIDSDFQDCDSIWETIGHRNTKIKHDGVPDTGFTWLHYAASRGWTSLIEKLIYSPGCNLDCATEREHFTPIFMACQGGHYDAVMLLLHNGADPCIQSTTGESCIHHLQRFDSSVSEKVAKELVSRGVDVDSKSGLTGQTPLAMACELGTAPDSLDWISALVDLGANILFEDQDGLTPVDIVTTHLEPELLDVLLQSSQSSEQNKWIACAKALHYLICEPFFKRLEYAGSAYQSNLSSIVDTLTSPGVLAAYKTVSASGNVLYDACARGAGDLVPLLLDHGLAADEPSLQGTLPLFEAIKGGYVEIATTLIDRGADITATDSCSRNILHIVAASLPEFLPHVARQLRSRGCDLHELANAGIVDVGITPFDEAVKAGNFGCANDILKLGAQYAELTRCLLGQGCDDIGWSSLSYAAASRTQLAYMLGLRPRPSMTVSSNGMTVFHLIAGSFDVWSSDDTSPANNAVFLIEDYGAREDAARPSTDGATPLHLAALTLNVAVAEVLLEVAGVDVNPVDVRGETPLDQLAMHEADQMEKRILTAAGTPIAKEMARLRPRDDLGAYIIHERLEAMRKLLLKYGAVSGEVLKKHSSAS